MAEKKEAERQEDKKLYSANEIQGKVVVLNQPAKEGELTVLDRPGCKTKFAYALNKNLEKMERILKRVRESSKQSAEYKKYLAESEKATSDEERTILNNKYKKAIDAEHDRIDDFNEFCKEEQFEIDWYQIPYEMLPGNVTPREYRIMSDFISEPKEEET